MVYIQHGIYLGLELISPEPLILLIWNQIEHLKYTTNSKAALIVQTEIIESDQKKA